MKRIKPFETSLKACQKVLSGFLATMGKWQRVCSKQWQLLNNAFTAELSQSTASRPGKAAKPTCKIMIMKVGTRHMSLVCLNMLLKPKVSWLD